MHPIKRKFCTELNCAKKKFFAKKKFLKQQIKIILVEILLNCAEESVILLLCKRNFKNFFKFQLEIAILAIFTCGAIY